MYVKEVASPSKVSVKQRVRDLAAFMKLRLTLLVVLSSGLGYAMGAESFSWWNFILLSISGVLVAGASNGFNQIIEREYDAQMDRTRKRPIPEGRMSPTTALIIGISSALTGLGILFFLINPLSAILGALALVSYTFLYTPLKRVTPLAVFVGAFPGAIPPMLGYVAATGKFDLFAGLLFAIQFMWQFPHFWAIAWVAHDDYKAAGYQLLPSHGGRNRKSAAIILLYNLFLIPVSLLPWVFSLTGNISAWAALILGVLFCIPAVRLLKSLEIADARKLMFASFFYLPILQLVFWLVVL